MAATQKTSLGGISEENIVDYYDIMIVGRTGMGKSTTSDKLVIANLENRDYRGEPYVEETVEENRIKMSDLSIWLIYDDEGELDRVIQRLKSLVWFRSLDKPHKGLNKFYMYRSEQTMKSQLISNETTKVRILDIPGLFPPLTTSASVSHSDSLANMREVLRIQAVMRMNFKRILYFIPKRGALDRDNRIVQMELKIMMHYFGKSIFDCMVLVATVNPNVYQYLQPGIIPFSKNNEEMTQKHFQRSLSSILPQGERLPDRKPPIVFISMTDTCEDIVIKIKSAPVIFNGIRLTYEHRMCIHCGIKTKLLKKEGEVVKIACYAGDDPSLCIPYEKSCCHPMIKSKYWGITKLLRGISHIITGRRYSGYWPNFRNPDDEVCIKCGMIPGLPGCMQVNTYYIVKNEKLVVDHELSEPIVTDEQKYEDNTIANEKGAQVSFLQQKILKCDHSGLQYSMIDYGMTLIVPKGSVATGKEIHMEIGVTLCGPFKFPKSSRPISPIISLRLLGESTLTESFQLHVTLRHILGELTELKAQHHRIQFCCNDHVSSDPGTYKFHPNNGGLISQSFTGSYGLIIMRKVCILCMTAADTSELQSEISYRLTRVICTSELKNEAYLCLSYDAYLQVYSLWKLFVIDVINPRRTREGYCSRVCICVCVCYCTSCYIPRLYIEN